MPETEARYYDKQVDDMVYCQLCPHRCHIKSGKVGVCGVRENRAGVLYSLNYGEVSSLALDPIEKKPLYHFYPGRLILSAGSFGCNLSCSFCQNYSIARHRAPTSAVGPEEMVDVAVQAADQGSIGVAFTYNEPSIWFEYVMDTASRLKMKGLKCVLVTNGFLGLKPLEELLPYIDAMNIDVKAFTNRFYHRHCKADLDQVKATVEAAAGRTHVEITNLIIPGENDDMEEIKALAGWLSGLSPFIPLHLSRYFPAYQMTIAPTPAATIRQAVQTAREHLKFVYAGNLEGIAENTLCPHCGQELIARHGYVTRVSGIKERHCCQCGLATDFIIT
jgi:pyruvate formate lyase activating enzyme